jgi:hypothetical protein
MSSLPSHLEAKMLAQVLKKAELEQKNKQAAKEQLLRIQLMLAKKVAK